MKGTRRARGRRDECWVETLARARVLLQRGAGFKDSLCIGLGWVGVVTIEERRFLSLFHSK